jgi:hypothetical protein
VTAKTESDKIVKLKESRTNSGAAASNFESSVVRATGDMPKSSNQLGRTMKERVLEE